MDEDAQPLLLLTAETQFLQLSRREMLVPVFVSLLHHFAEAAPTQVFVGSQITSIRRVHATVSFGVACLGFLQMG